MLYGSTRGTEGGKSSAYVIKNGMARDGGLFVPDAIPSIDRAFLERLSELGYAERAAKILRLFLTDYGEGELLAAAKAAYGTARFGSVPAPVVRAGRNFVLELWHGPTCAFKDFALQIMPRLLSLSLDKCGEKRDALILVATSGDTGKAALAGFADVPRTRIQVFYPADGVSPIQKLQMTTQEGANVSVCAVKGNFDDAQSAVKRIFTSESAAKYIGERGLFFSSANSINWGRLAPQIVYYVSAYCDLAKGGHIAVGDIINVTVPTGNFGNILAAYIAKKAGLPIGKLVCASNSNNILTDFFKTGVYDTRRPFYTTISPSMDILVSSNLERLLYFKAGAAKCAAYMESLRKDGVFSVESGLRAAFAEDFGCGFCTEAQTEATIGEYFKAGYLCDPHTAVALHCADEYVGAGADGVPMLVASTASPFKFPRPVLRAVGGEAAVAGAAVGAAGEAAGGAAGEAAGDDFACLAALEDLSGQRAPASLAALKNKEARFTQVAEKDGICPLVYDFASGEVRL